MFQAGKQLQSRFGLQDDFDWLNYHHLLYFWTVAREGTIARAGEKLHLGQPAISSQLKQLEQSLGVKVFQKSGRNLELTETGRIVYRYADEIFSIGRELTDTIKGRPAGRFDSWLGLSISSQNLLLNDCSNPLCN